MLCNLQAARLASFVHFLASYLTLQQVASKQFKPSSIAAAKPAVQTWNFREYLPGSKDKYNMVRGCHVPCLVHACVELLGSMFVTFVTLLHVC